MGRFLLRRIGHGGVVVLGVSIIVFVVTRLIGDPVDVMLPLEATAEERARFAAQLGFDRLLHVQFIDFLGSVARFDFGESLWQRRPAIEAVWEALPSTLVLVFASIAIAVVLAIPLGTIASLRPGGMTDRLVVSSGLVGLSIPNFWLGLLLILLFSVKLGLLPNFGSGSLAHAILPTVTFALPATARLMILVRSSMIDELNSQYVQLAKAKNLPLVRVVGVHAFRNATIPVVTLVGWELIRALAGYSVIVETVFSWPGLGLLTMEAINRQDLILLQASVFVVALMIVIVNLLLDVIYRAIDPRIKLA